MSKRYKDNPWTGEGKTQEVSRMGDITVAEAIEMYGEKAVKDYYESRGYRIGFGSAKPITHL